MRSLRQADPDAMARRRRARTAAPTELEIESTALIVPPATAPRCPICDVTMMRRQSRAKSYFWGCTRYPHCRGTRPTKT